MSCSFASSPVSCAFMTSSENRRSLTRQDQELQRRPAGAKKGAHFLLPQALVENGIGMAGIDQVRHTKSFCLVAQAPSAEWVAPLHRYFRLGTDWDFHHSKSTVSRSSQRDDISNGQTARPLRWAAGVWASRINSHCCPMPWRLPRT